MIDTSSTQDRPLDDLVGRLADEFLERLRQGEKPSAEEYASRHPEVAELIRQVFPTLEVMGETEIHASGNGDPLGHDSKHGVIGDYRIIREVGRGGMGVVYEAQQLSLDRRVALKVLPFAAVLDERQIKRFRNEARAAAQLKHPNIVQVHGVGCERSVHFYAMELVEGETIAKVIADLRRLEGPAVAPVRQETTARDFGSRQHAPSVKPREVSNRKAKDERSREKREPSTSSSSPKERFRNVAQLGAQIAEALDHAHHEGVVHRDIKPSNLMLDRWGKPWVTDFGLARIESDAGMTMTGDLLGTLRYMSPEQTLAKRVIVDHRADIYSLGVTLYELLTLQPAFPQKEHQELLKHINFDDPIPPRRQNRKIPADLETIVLKAIQKNPSDRYETAEEMAADLRRYLSDEPIRAKRPTSWQVGIKWAKRHATAVRFTVAAFILATITGVAAIVYKEQQNAEELRKHLYISDMNSAMQAWNDNNIRLVLDLLNRHRPEPWQNDLRGFEWRYLWRLCEESRHTLRLDVDHNVSTVSFSPTGEELAVSQFHDKIVLYKLSDSKTPEAYHEFRLSTDQRFENSDMFAIFSPIGTTLAYVGRDVTVVLLRSASDREIELRGHTDKVVHVAFSSRGTLIASASLDKTVRIWDTATGELMRELNGAPSVRRLAFSSDGRWLAGGCNDGTIKVWDVEDWQPVWTDKPHANRVNSLSFSRDSRLLASGGEDRAVKLWSVGDEQLQLLIELHHQDAVRSVAFSPVDDVLATGGRDHIIKLWNLSDYSVRKTLKGHSGIVTSLAFSPNGENLASGGRDRAVRLWDVRRRNLPDSINLPDRVHRLGALKDGNLMVGFGPPRGFSLDLCICDPNDGQTSHLADIPQKISDIDVSPQTGTLAMAAGKTIHLWNLQDSDFEESLRHTGLPRDVALIDFNAAGNKIAIGCDDGTVEIWDLESRSCRQLAEYSDPVTAIAFSGSGRALAIGNEYGEVAVWYVDRSKTVTRHLKHRDAVTALVFSSDDLLASGSVDHSIIVWQLSTGTSRKLTGHSHAVYSLLFSSDGRTLVSAAGDRVVRLWDVETLQQKMVLRGHESAVISLAWLSDESLLASGGREGTVRLWRAAPRQNHSSD